MNTLKIYSDVTGKTELAEKRATPTPSDYSPAEEATKTQSYIDWLSNINTKKMFSSLIQIAEECEAAARQCAVTPLKEVNYQNITYNLTKADVIRNIVKTYGRIHTSS